MAMPELIEVPLSSNDLAARYRALCNDPCYANVPGKIELDAWRPHGDEPREQLPQRPASPAGGASSPPWLGARSWKPRWFTSAGVLVADVAWASDEFMRARGFETPYLRSPELCIEVVSPSNSRKELREKVAAYLEAGAVEVLDRFLPQSKRAEFHTAGKDCCRVRSTRSTRRISSARFAARRRLPMRILLAALLAAPLHRVRAVVSVRSRCASSCRFAPAAASDLAGRLVAAKLSERMGTQFIVENRPGAGSNLGAEIAGQERRRTGTPCWLIVGELHGQPQRLQASPSIRSTNITTSIIQISRGPYVVAIHPSVPPSNLKEFVEYARKQPEKLAYGSSGSGSIMHVASEYFLDAAKIKVLHIPLKGTGPAVADSIGGQVQLVFGAVPVTLPHVKAGRLAARSP
jgi:hypothetical protein